MGMEKRVLQGRIIRGDESRGEPAAGLENALHLTQVVSTSILLILINSMSGVAGRIRTGGGKIVPHATSTREREEAPDPAGYTARRVAARA